MNEDHDCIGGASRRDVASPEALQLRVETSVIALSRREPIRASEPIPDEIQGLLRVDDVPGRAGKAQAIAATMKHMGGRIAREPTEAHCPRWLDLEFVPKLLPFRERASAVLREAARHYQFVEPVSLGIRSGPDVVPFAGEALRYIYPWRTIGKVFVGHGTDFDNPTDSGSGVLVGRNLILTASHVAPWGRGPGQWWMRFIPGYRKGDVDPEPHSSSYVEEFFGTYSDVSDPEASGTDYVICKLYRPLGDALGWMGSRSFGSEAAYYSRRFISVGYPNSFSGRPAVEFDIDIDDIDSDGSGLELETTYGSSPFGPGWSGGPLWMWENEKPYVVGILSGHEKDELDPRRFVFGGGGLLVDRVKHGLAHFA
jgi:hypothetical protein